MILIVDDSADTRVLLERLLKTDGYSVSSVASGGEALIFLETHKPRLILLDYGMPDMDGLTVFEHLKQDSRFTDIPVVMYSAHGAAIKEKALQAGVDAYVTKGSLDWFNLEREVRRLAGAGNPARDFPETPLKMRKCDG